jgi:hypothetical protein
VEIKFFKVEIKFCLQLFLKGGFKGGNKVLPPAFFKRWI